jgi:hypothetical protein
LQAICDRLGPGAIWVFAERWWSILPLSLTEHDRAAGYWWELSMRQVETSRSLVFDAPRRARGFFEALAAGKNRYRLTGDGVLPPCVGHAKSRDVSGGSEMIQLDGREELSRQVQA